MGGGTKSNAKSLILSGAGRKGKARAHKAKPKQRAKKTCGRTYETEVKSPSCPPANPQTGPHQALLVLSPHPRVSPNPAEKEKTEQHRTAKKSQAHKRKGTPPNPAKAHQGKAKPSKKHLKPAPKPKWGGKSETEARKT